MRRLCEVIAGYYQASEAGRAPQLQTLIDQHPDMAAELARYFSEQNQLGRIAKLLHEGEAVPLHDSERINTLRFDTQGLAWAATPVSLLEGVRQFGDYELLEELAVGGMGVIYKARQVSLNRLVVLKIIRTGEFASAAEIRRFRAEAETVADLDHPNIVPIHEVGEHLGYHFFSMKLVQGGSLAIHLDRYLDDPRAASRIVATLARAIHHAHQRGVPIATSSRPTSCSTSGVSLYWPISGWRSGWMRPRT